MIFETERLLTRKLKSSDLNEFHKLESNPNVLKYADGEVKSYLDNEKELKGLIAKYTQRNNNFWIYAIERKSDFQFLGTLALVKDGKDDEIGYRFLQKYWGNGYGFEVCKGLISYCKQLKLQKLIAYCVDDNVASAKILEKLGFKSIKHFVRDDIKLPETKYELLL